MVKKTTPTTGSNAILPPVLKPGEMVVGKIEVAQDTSAERAAGAPHQLLTPVDPFQPLVSGDVVLLRVGEDLYRPLLITVVYKGPEGPVINGTVFFEPLDNTPWMQATLRQRVSQHAHAVYLYGLKPGHAVGQWRRK